MASQMLDARTHGRANAQVILYSVQCYALNWTDNNIGRKNTIYTAYSLWTEFILSIIISAKVNVVNIGGD